MTCYEKKKNIFEMQSKSIVCAEMITDEKTRNKKKSIRTGFEPAREDTIGL